MALEAATYISELVTTNPVGAADFVSGGDDHIRLIKSAIKTTFPNASRPFYLPNTTALQSSTVNVVSTDQSKVVPVSCEAAARTVNLPAGSGLPDGFEVTVVKADHSPNLLTIDASGSETINGALTAILHQRYQLAKLIWCSTIAGWIADIPDITPIGSVQPSFNSTLPPGWLWFNGQSIGNGSSAGTARANADCLGLFTVLWNSLSDTYAPVSTGRGASAAADFAANKRLTLPNLSGRMVIGKDIMGSGGDAGLIGAVITDALGASAGAETVTLAQANLPNVTLAVSGTTDAGGNHGHPFRTSASGGGTTDTEGALALENDGTLVNQPAYTGALGDTPGQQIGASGTHTHGFSATTASINGNTTQTAISNLPPAMVGLWMVKL